MKRSVRNIQAFDFEHLEVIGRNQLTTMGNVQIVLEGKERRCLDKGLEKTVKVFFKTGKKPWPGKSKVDEDYILMIVRKLWLLWCRSWNHHNIIKKLEDRVAAISYLSTWSQQNFKRRNRDVCPLPVTATITFWRLFLKMKAFSHRRTRGST